MQGRCYPSYEPKPSKERTPVVTPPKALAFASFYTLLEVPFPVAPNGQIPINSAGEYISDDSVFTHALDNTAVEILVPGFYEVTVQVPVISAEALVAQVPQSIALWLDSSLLAQTASTGLLSTVGDKQVLTVSVVIQVTQAPSSLTVRNNLPTVLIMDGFPSVANTSASPSVRLTIKQLP